MTSKKSHTLRIESEIDRNREDGHWQKVIQLAEHLKVQYPSNGKCLSFLTPLLSSAAAAPWPFLAAIPPSDRGCLSHVFSLRRHPAVSCEKKRERERVRMTDRGGKKDVTSCKDQGYPQSERNVTLVSLNCISPRRFVPTTLCAIIYVPPFFFQTPSAIALPYGRHAEKNDVYVTHTVCMYRSNIAAEYFFQTIINVQ